MTFRDHFDSYLDSVRREDRDRTFTIWSGAPTVRPMPFGGTMAPPERWWFWCSNDYLGRHPAVINPMIETAVRKGVGRSRYVFAFGNRDEDLQLVKRHAAVLGQWVTAHVPDDSV